MDLWGDAESCCHTQGLPPATWLHQGITTLFSTSRYTLVLTFKPTSKMWGGMMWPLLETTPKTITVAVRRVVRCVELCPQALNRPDLHFEGVGNGSVFITWIGREHELYSGASPILLIEYYVTFRHDRRLLSLLGFVHNWPTSRCSATKKENRFSFKQKWNHVIFSRATIVPPCMYIYQWCKNLILQTLVYYTGQFIIGKKHNLLAPEIRRTEASDIFNAPFRYSGKVLWWVLNFWPRLIS